EVTVLQDVGLRQRLTVDQGAVPAAQVPDAHRVGGDRELGVIATDLLAGRPEVARLTATDLELRAGQRDNLPLRFALNDDQLHFHGYRPDLMGHRPNVAPGWVSVRIAPSLSHGRRKPAQPGVRA